MDAPRQKLMKERATVVATTTLGFVSAAAGDFHLKPGSPLIDRGAVLFGFNDPDSRWPYHGAAPNVGAFEYAP